MLIYGGGIVTAKLASLILVPLYTRWLTQAQYGTLELLSVTIDAVTKVLWGGFPYAVWYFYANAPAGDRRTRVISTGVWAALGLGIAGALAGSLLAPRVTTLVWGSADNATLLRIAFLGLICAFPLEVALSWFRILDEPFKYIGSNLARLLLNVALAVFLLVVCDLGLTGVLWSGVLSGSLVAAVVLVHTFRRTGFAIEPSLLARMARYASPAMFVGSCSFLVHFGDRYFLQRYASLADLGVYSLAYKFGMLVTLAQYAFQGYWNAQVFRVATRPSADALLGRALTYLTLALCAVGLTVTAFARPVVALLAPPAYAPSARLVPLVAAGYVMFGLSAYFQTLFYVKKRTGSDAILSAFGALLAGLGYVTLIPRYKLWGAAAATLLSFAGSLALGILWSRRFIAVRYEYGRLWKVVSPWAVLIILHSVAPPVGVLAGFGFGAASLGVFALTLLAARFFDPSEVEFARRSLVRLLPGRHRDH